MNTCLFIRQPSGIGWRFSLNPAAAPADFQDSPLFLLDKDGNAFVDGNTYTVAVLHEETGIIRTQDVIFQGGPAGTALLDLALIPSFQQTTDRSRFTTQVIHTGGYETTAFGDAPDATYLLVEQATPDGVKIARRAISSLALPPAVKPALVLGTVPSFTATVGIAKTVNFLANVVTAPDGAEIGYAADGPLAAGITLDKDQRNIGINVAVEGTVSVKLVASTADGRTKKFTISVEVSPDGSARFINAIYAETNIGGSFSSYVMGSVRPGEVVRQILRGKAGTASAGYTARTRIAATQPGGFPSYTRLFEDKADFASLWGNVNGVDDRPPFPTAGNTLTYELITEVLTADTLQPVEPALYFIDDVVFEGVGVSKQSYPTDGEVINRPPEYQNNLPGTLEVETGKTVPGNASTLFRDYENDAYSYYYDVPFGNEADISLNTTTGEYEVGAKAGKFAIYVIDQLGRRVSSGWCTVTVKQSAQPSLQQAGYALYWNQFPSVPRGGNSYSASVVLFQLSFVNRNLLNLATSALRTQVFAQGNTSTPLYTVDRPVRPKTDVSAIGDGEVQFAPVLATADFEAWASDYAMVEVRKEWFPNTNGFTPAGLLFVFSIVLNGTSVVELTRRSTAFPLYYSTVANGNDPNGPTGRNPVIVFGATAPSTIDEWANTATTYNPPANLYYTDPNKFKLITEITAGGKLRLVRDEGTAQADADHFILYRIDNMNVGGVGSLDGIELEGDQSVQIMKLMVPNGYVGQNNFYAQLKFARWVETAEFNNPL